jgi:hypothetical protein
MAGTARDGLDHHKFNTQIEIYITTSTQKVKKFDYLVHGNTTPTDKNCIQNMETQFNVVTLSVKCSRGHRLRHAYGNPIRARRN